MTNYLAALTAALMLGFAHAAGAQSFITPKASEVPGGVFVIVMPGSADSHPEATFSGEPVLVARQNGAWVAVVCIPLDTEPGEYQVEVAGKPIRFQVVGKQYAVQQ